MSYSQAYNEVQRQAMFYALTGKNILITGAGGTGKSMLISDLLDRLEDKEIRRCAAQNTPPGVVGMTAMTGCAATLTGGQTLHSLLGLTPKTQTYDEIMS